jgi:hypothetical protein
MYAWGKIKKPYKELINILLSSPMHVFFCGRQGNEFETDEDSGELKKVGVKMKAEGETPYEPHILIHMEGIKDKKGNSIITAFAEKDRTGILAGRTIEWPDFDNMIKPLLSTLGGIQATITSEEETGQKDAERITKDDLDRTIESGNIKEHFQAKLVLCKTKDELRDLNNELTPEVKKKMTSSDMAELRESWVKQADKIKQ